MKKYLVFALSITLLPTVSFAQNRNNALQQISKQRDIADNNCRNNLPNPRAAIGFCKKRDGLQKKLDNMNNPRNNYNNNNINNSDRNGDYNNNHHNHHNNHRQNHNN
ncbi:hypothetical protein [Commensalibacter papalotli (ex Botero et al. 2024)]|uniref:Conjugal transfer protein TrbK n=1 Tax=Commensalibacter papalotli (ex Botero et al. 2024) TaxID=2972766 RepID=A0ABN8W6G0_9PROT|nr:hypothetical protein [Commensalibacter papalotli (ex Botero et al. 2024)]CAI3923163.1 unnamed protein product [Commensalibacter papalotli (ex Botero et al. 2024)]CAI3928850.1 unnamed protein product [Commensalibacter papalotli (ex Botero et al. 2024)]